MDFRAYIRELASKKRSALEIGPSYNPVLPKADGFPVTVMDHADTATIREKYRMFGVDTSRIEDVDIVGTDLSAIANSGRLFDIIVASHLVEHTTDLIRFLQGCEQCLVDHGLVALIVPDKRYCFDFFRPLTTAGTVIDAYFAKRSKHLGALFDHYAYFVRNHEQMAWSPANSTELDLQFIHDDAIINAAFQSAMSSPVYVDAHEWVFTPNSFRLVMHDLMKVQYTILGEAAFFVDHAHEFLVILEKNGAPPFICRNELVRLVEEECCAASPTVLNLRRQVRELQAEITSVTEMLNASKEN